MNSLHLFTVIVLVSLASAIAFLNLPGQQNETPSSAKATYSENFVVEVGGEKITANDVEEGYANLPEAARQNLTKDQYLDSMIKGKLLLSKADEKGIEASQEEVDKYMEALQASYSMDDKNLEQMIVENGYTMEEFKDAIKDQITVSKLLNEELGLEKITVSEAEVDAYIKERPEFSDFYEEGDPELIGELRARVRYVLRDEKQKTAIDSYISSLDGEVVQTTEGQLSK